MLVLQDQAKLAHRFAYHGLGISVGVPVSRFLPKVVLPKIVINGKYIGATGATTDFPSGGVVYATSTTRAELTTHDFEGGAIFLELGAGLLFGGSVTAIFTGVSEYMEQVGCIFPQFIGAALSTARATIFMYGANEGLQESIGVGLMFGQITYKGLYSDDE